MKDSIIYISIFVVIFTNIFSSLYIGNADAYEKKQKIVQITLIWLVPIIGSIFFSLFLYQDRKEIKINKQIGNNSNISHSEAISHGSQEGR